MHVGLFSPASPDSGVANGIVTYVRHLRTALVAIGCRVTILTPSQLFRSDGSIEPLPTLPLARRALQKAKDRFFSHGLAERAKRFSTTVIWAHQQDPFDIFELEETFGLSRFIPRHIPVVVRLHGPHYLGRDANEQLREAELSHRRIAAERLGIMRANGITSPSRKLLAEVVSYYALGDINGLAIPNPMPHVPQKARWLNAEYNKDRIICVGRFDLRKGADIAIGAFVKVASVHKSATLTLIGPDVGLRLSNGTRLNQAEYIRTNVPPEYANRIEFMGTLSADAIDAARRTSAVCLIASRFETFSYALAEALALSMPIVTADTFGTSEIIQDGENGFTTPVGDTTLMAQRLLDILASEKLRQLLSDKAYERANSFLDFREVAENTVAFYQKTIKLTAS